MTRDIIELNDFVILIEESDSEQIVVDKCGFDEDVVGFSFYGSGNVALNIHNGNKVASYNNTKGVALSFFANNKIDFVHNIGKEKPLQCICVFLTLRNLEKMSEQEKEVFSTHLNKLLHPKDNYEEGPIFFMTPDMQNAVEKIFNTQYKGATRNMFLKSQVTELLTHFVAKVADSNAANTINSSIKMEEREKLYQAKEIITENIDTPPSLNELSKLIGLNSYKLKKNFKELFGVPVFKYLQNERLNKAHELLNTSEISIQEAAWHVGYESLSSFSSAFMKKFGFRPSEIKK